MKAKIIFLSMLTLATILTSCQEKSFSPDLAASFFPLGRGLKWSYRIVDITRGTMHILSEQVIGQTRASTGDPGVEVESEYSGPSGRLNSSIIYFSENGYIARQSRIATREITPPERAFLPQFLKPGLTWSNSIVPFEPEPQVFHVSQTHRTFFETRTVEVPAGTFSGCIRLETDALYQNSTVSQFPLKLKYVDWYAPRVGLVKTVVKQSGFFSSELWRIELLSFNSSQAQDSVHMMMARVPGPQQRAASQFPARNAVPSVPGH